MGTRILSQLKRRPGETADEIREMCNFCLDISCFNGETLAPFREELHIVPEIFDPEQIFVPKVKKG